MILPLQRNSVLSLKLQCVRRVMEPIRHHLLQYLVIVVILVGIAFPVAITSTPTSWLTPPAPVIDELSALLAA